MPDQQLKPKYDLELHSPNWLDRFPRIGFQEYYEKWRKKAQEAQGMFAGDEPGQAPEDAYTFEKLAFETAGGLRLLLKLYMPFALSVFATSFFWDFHGLLRACSIAGMIGFGTNWIAVKMLFRPRSPRPIFGQGLIPSQRQEILTKVADEICEKLINESKIRQEIEERELVAKMTAETLQQLQHLVREPEFVNDTRSMLLTVAEDLVGKQEFRAKVVEACEERMREVAGQSLSNYLLDKARHFWFGPVHPLVDRELDALPETIDKVLKEFGTIIDRLPTVLNNRRELIEETLTRIVMAFVKEVDMHSMLTKTLDTVTPAQLEQSFHEFADDKLSYITLLGGVLGAIGGMIIVWPFHSIIGLLILAAGLGLADLLLYPMMSHRLWPRQHEKQP